MRSMAETKWCVSVLAVLSTGVLLIHVTVASADSPANVLAAWSDGTVEPGIAQTVHDLVNDSLPECWVHRQWTLGEH